MNHNNETTFNNTKASARFEIQSLQRTSTAEPVRAASALRLADCHTHTIFSDGKSTFEENARAALAAGISTLVCTDHWGRPDFVDASIEESRLPEYAAAIRQARDEFPSLEIVHGLEADWYHGCAKDLAQTTGDATFLLGSVHYLKQKAIDWNEDMRIWKELGANGVWKLYTSEWCAAATSGLSDSMAHPDLPRLMSAEGFTPTCDLAPLYKDMAHAAKEGGVHVEINTAGLLKGFSDFYPARPLLEAFYQAGVPLTVGSDAHHASRIGAHILDAYHYAKSVGYQSIDAPCAQGGWRSISLAEL